MVSLTKSVLKHDSTQGLAYLLALPNVSVMKCVCGANIVDTGFIAVVVTAAAVVGGVVSIAMAAITVIFLLVLLAFFYCTTVQILAWKALWEKN